HRFAQIFDCNKIDAACAKRARVEILLIADNHLARVALDLDHVERRACGHTESFSLSDGEVVNASVLANHLAVGGDYPPGVVVQRSATLGDIGVEKLLVVAAGNE